MGACLGSAETGGGRASADVWFAWCAEHVEDVPALTDALLSRDERDHMHGYRSAEAAVRYVVTRALVRSVLAERLHRAPADIVLSRTSAGKPVLDDSLHFNITHSGDLVLLAVSAAGPVGVDVERRRRVPRVAALEARWLTGQERSDFNRLRALGIDASDAFLRVWSLKEARLKALGVGIVGASTAPVQDVEALPLDDLLSSLTREGEDPQYVGAIAFA
ncbi:MAG TPA: 4'-phosphopantetheinyl transferase superfamily protein [Gemmatimonadaceae bacterium]|nr:4'-phosphopantetheinyl transferase superfamily protein [Gemmatimonadaceae bacterium]